MDLAADAGSRRSSWIDGERVFYRVIGISWGGAAPRRGLAIRFRANRAVGSASKSCPAPASIDDAGASGRRPGVPNFQARYQIVLERRRIARFAHAALDYFYYTREVEIDRV